MPKIASRVQSLGKLSAWFQQHLSFHFNKATSWKEHVQQTKLSLASFSESCSWRKKLIRLLYMAQSRVRVHRQVIAPSWSSVSTRGPGCQEPSVPANPQPMDFMFLSPGWNQYPCYQIHYLCITNILPYIVDNLEFSLSIEKIPWHCGFIVPHTTVFLETAGYWNVSLIYTVGIYMHDLGFLW